jgi:hypothetical protein
VRLEARTMGQLIWALTRVRARDVLYLKFLDEDQSLDLLSAIKLTQPTVKCVVLDIT